MGYYDTYYRAEVRRAGRLTPHMVRIVLGGGDLHRFVSTGVADERLVVVFPSPGESEPPAPLRQPDGTADYPDEGSRPEMRSYTVRAFDAGRAEMTIDFVAHQGGVASSWAMEAGPGDVVYLTGAGGWYAPPADSTWELLVVDMTALPALGRIVESLPAGRRAYVIAEVIEPADRQEFVTPAEVSYSWLVGSGHGVGPSSLPEAVRRFDWPDGPGYLWFAGEAATSRAVRKHVRHELGWTADRYEILGYWRVRKEEWMARYERIGAELEEIYERAVADGLSSNDALELYDDALERAGL